MSTPELDSFPSFNQGDKQLSVGPDGLSVKLRLPIRGKKWETIRNAIVAAVENGLGPEFSGKINVRYSTPSNRKSVDTVMMYATPNGLAGYDIVVNPINSH